MYRTNIFSEINGSLTIARESQKCTEVSGMYFQTKNQKIHRLTEIQCKIIYLIFKSIVYNQVSHLPWQCMIMGPLRMGMCLGPRTIRIRP